MITISKRPAATAMRHPFFILIFFYAQRLPHLVFGREHLSQLFELPLHFGREFRRLAFFAAHLLRAPVHRVIGAFA
jgi:hypothetical protein